mmetsp:Transcript_81928/g.237584  ORF Transcript_81928/g.237584 Transcript_81928/m.237584 type:complete len:246 (-) Transcript_81928:1612-2349(-)
MLDVAGLVVLVPLGVRFAEVVHVAIEDIALLQKGADLRQAHLVQRGALFIGVAEDASTGIRGRGALLGCVDELRLIHHAMPEPPLVGGFVDDHGVLHIVAGVRNHSHYSVGPCWVQVALRRIVHLCSHHGLLRVEDPEDLVVGPVAVVMVGRAHGLLQHLALVHVPRTLVVVREGCERRQQGENLRRPQFLVGVPHRQLLRHLVLTHGASPTLGLQREVGPLFLLGEGGDAEEDLFQRADELLLP